MSQSPHASLVPTRIVGLGGSAGSFEAVEKILRALEPQTGMAFVYVLHLKPDRESLATRVLQRWTEMPVRDATDGQRLEANCVYVIQPDHDLFLEGGCFRTASPRTMARRHHQVDIFLESLAEDAGPRAVAVILSGGDGDGAQGLAAVKFRGGVTIAQNFGSARIPSMPENAVETGCVDDVLAPAQIAAELNALAGETIPPDTGDAGTRARAG